MPLDSDSTLEGLGDLQPNQGLRTATQESGGSLEEESDSGDEFVNTFKAAKRRQPPSMPTRSQPLRAATKAGVIDDSASGKAAVIDEWVYKHNLVSQKRSYAA